LIIPAIAPATDAEDDLDETLRKPGWLCVSIGADKGQSF
jgi:hypothetical protein